MSDHGSPMPVPGARVVVIGQGYVGLPLSVRATLAGFDVIGFEVDPAKIAALESQTSYVEDISDEELQQVHATGRFRATNDPGQLKGFDYAVIAVPTPLRESLPDLSFIEEAGELVGQHLTAGSTVILESTTYPGTTDQLLRSILEVASGLTVSDFYLGYSPERIDPGNLVYHLGNTPKIVAGIDAASLQRVEAFYAALVDTVIPVSTTGAAELAKLLENTFRHVNIALVNEMAIFAHDLGIDIWEAIGAASTKPFGFMPFYPGPGVGGHCLPVDPSYLSWQVRRRLGHNFRFVELANDVNEHMPDYVVQRLAEGLNLRRMPINGTRVVLIGLTYKKNTSDARESPALRVARLLHERGAVVMCVDPHVLARDVPDFVEVMSLDDLRSEDAVIILTDHDAISYDVLESHPGHVLDTRRRLHGSADVL